jgi:hypothetical protein
VFQVLEQLEPVDGLVEHGHDRPLESVPHAPSSPADLFRVQARENDDRDPGEALVEPHAPGHLETAHRRQQEVQDDDVDRFRPEKLESTFPRPRGARGVPARILEDPLHESARLLIVLDDQDVQGASSGGGRLGRSSQLTQRSRSKSLDEGGGGMLDVLCRMGSWFM